MDQGKSADGKFPPRTSRVSRRMRGGEPCMKRQLRLLHRGIPSPALAHPLEQHGYAPGRGTPRQQAMAVGKVLICAPKEGHLRQCCREYRFRTPSSPSKTCPIGKSGGCTMTRARRVKCFQEVRQDWLLTSRPARLSPLFLVFLFLTGGFLILSLWLAGGLMKRGTSPCFRMPAPLPAVPASALL